MIEYPRYTKLDPEYLKRKIIEFLAEDAPKGDVTTIGTIGKDEVIKAVIEAQEDLIFAGEEITKAFFGDSAQVKQLKNDGELVKNGEIICEITGNAIVILTKERSILNLLQRLCGIATLTRKYTKIAEPHGVKILDTRKTTPGLRHFEKYAVACGGGHNHRLDLSSGILIKDNHIAAAGSISKAIENIKKITSGLPIEVEIENDDDIREGLGAGADGFLFDNMSPEKTIESVKIVREFENGNDIFIESSGGINLNNLEGYMTTGINAVSSGALTHSVKSSEMHMEFI
jgi:nicotinate-nucleotide pyrophosphorylase (carboxylating)